MGSARLEGPEGADSWEELVKRGLVLEDAPAPIAALDAIPSAEDRDPGEGKDGVEVRRHPIVLLLEERRLWRIWDLWRTGAVRGMTPELYTRLPNFAVSAFMELSAAQAREDQRRMRRPPPPPEEGSNG